MRSRSRGTLLEPPPADPVAAAQAAHLRYVSDRRPGIRRLRAGKGFRYVDPSGKPVRDEDTRRRIRSLVIPPAWRDVWICPRADGHLQATGIDARGRKQYRYHPRWRAVRDEAKYDRVVAFALALPALRARVEADLALPGLPRRKVLATVVRLLEITCIRVGNEEYARSNHSYGLTTLRNHHVDVNGSRLRFHFRGKSGVFHDVTVTDRRLARILRRLQELPGQELFEYEETPGVVRAIGSDDVNEYLHEVTGQPFTAKDFRTWAGTLLAARALLACEPCASESQRKQNVVAAIDEVAQQLRNTRAVCRKCYVHPAILDAYLNASLEKAFPPHARQKGVEDEAVLAFLQKHVQSVASAAG